MKYTLKLSLFLVKKGDIYNNLHNTQCTQMTIKALKNSSENFEWSETRICFE